MKTVSKEKIPELLKTISAEFEQEKDELCRMDALLGDGDLGLTMSKGFAVTPETAAEELEKSGSIKKALVKAGMKLSSAAPSTMGFLMSSGVMEGGKAVADAEEFGAAELAEFLKGFAEGIKKRGKCEVGQRTIFDAIFPASQAALDVAEGGNDLQAVACAAKEAAEKGVEATKNMIPVFGKAAVHASSAVGIEDQGAKAGYLLVKAIYDFVNEN